jgi:hypothetical protein
MSSSDSTRDDVIASGLIAKYELFEDASASHAAADGYLRDVGFDRHPVVNTWTAPNGDADDILANLCKLLPTTARIMIIPVPLFHESDIRGHNLLTPGTGGVQ